MQQLQTDYNDVTALKQKDATLEQKLMELQSLSASQKSCFQLSLQGISTSGQFLLDPDGQHNNNSPIMVQLKKFAEPFVLPPV